LPADCTTFDAKKVMRLRRACPAPLEQGKACAAPQDVNAQVTEPRSRERQRPDPHPQRRLIARMAVPIPSRAPQRGQPTRLLHAGREALANPVDQPSAAGPFQTAFVAAPAAGCAGPMPDRPPGASPGHSLSRACASCAIWSRPIARASSSTRRKSPRRSAVAGSNPRPGYRPPPGAGRGHPAPR